MACNCGAEGAPVGHSAFCSERGGSPAFNRVLVGLPERLNSAKTALGDMERLIEDLRTIYSGRQLTELSDSEILDLIGTRLGLPVPGKCQHPKASRDSRGDTYCPDCKDYLL